MINTKRLLLVSAALLFASGGALAQGTADTAPTPPATAPADAPSTGAAPTPADTPPATAPPATPPSTEPPPSVPATPPAATAAAAEPGMEAVLGHPPAGMGQVVFFRPSSFMGVALVFHPREGETAYGSLASGRYFILNVTPGEHDFTVRSEVVNHLHVEAEEGETQYASLSLSMGIMAAHPNLQPSTAAAFQAALPHMRRGPDHEIPRPPSH